MAGNPNVQQGTLNRLRGSIVFSGNASLNITSSYLGREGVSATPESDASQLIGTMTGGVTSPEPYQMIILTAHLLKSQALSDTYKKQIETNTSVGDITFIPDAATLSNYNYMNATLLGTPEILANGSTADFVIRIRCIYQTNSDLFNAT